MKSIFLKCLVGTLFVTTLVVFLNYIFNIDIEYYKLVQSTIIFFVLIFFAEIIRYRIKKNNI